MNKVDFHKHLQNSSATPVLTTAELERLVERYPYFQTAQLLLSKAYLTDGDYRQTDQVQQAALYAGDRSALFHWLRAKSTVAAEITTEAPAPPTELVSPEPVSERIAEPETTFAPIVADILEIEQEPIPVPADSALRALADRIVDESAAEAAPKPIMGQDEMRIVWTPALEPQTPAALVTAPTEETPQEIEATTIPTTTNAPAILPELQETILIEAIHSALEQEILEDVRQQQDENPVAPAETPVDDSTLSPFARWMQQRSKEIAFEADVRPMPAGEQPEDVQNWLRKPVEEELSEEMEEDAPTGIEERLEDLAPEEGQGLIAHSARRMDVPQKKDQQKALIDRFIQLDPRITPGKAADYSISDLAKESLEDDLEYVTETMAQLFVIQGKIDRAKKAFKKLMVLHPEKSVYFATQLKNIDRIKKL